MDPLTHALAGAAAARVVVRGRLGRAEMIAGAAAAMLPDVDALIRSQSDPLLYAEFHRHFTHSLAFIPIGGVVAALPWLIAHRAQAAPKVWWVAAAMAGYATHGVLDASTTYGTLLYWPFSDMRVAWNIIPIVDPLFTLALLIGVAFAAARWRAWPAAIGLAAAVLYLGAGMMQRDRALEAQAVIAEARGHARERAAVFPGFGSILLWRSLYASGDALYADRIRVAVAGEATFAAGYEMTPLREDDVTGEVAADARLRRDLARFRWFTGGWVAPAPGDPTLLGDARYSARTDAFEPVWGVRLTPGAAVPVDWIDRSGDRRIDPAALWRELTGTEPSYRVLSRR